MYRLKILAALLLPVLLSACSGSAPGSAESRGPLSRGNEVQSGHPSERGQVQPESERSAPASITPVSAEFARRMRMPDESLLEELELPADELLGKLPSVTQTSSLNGSQHFKFSPGKASNAGTAKRLNSATGTAWVMYRFQGLNFHRDPATVKLMTSNEGFSGAEAGYVLAIANYEQNRWQVLGSTQVASQYIRGLNVGDAYRSPAQNVYIAVILPAAQSLDVESIELVYDEVNWLNVEIDSEAGWTPGLGFLPNGNIFIAYGDFNVGLPLAAVLDRALDPGKPSNWVVGEMNSNGQGVGLGQDIVIGPSGTPRVSLAYTAIGRTEYNTLMGFTAYYNEGTSNEAGFWNYELGSGFAIQELAGSSSTDYNSAASKYGFANHFYNYSDSTKDGSARYRQFTLNETVPQDNIDAAGGLTAGGYWFPRVRFAPGDSLLYFANNGGFLTYESAPNTLTDIYTDTSSHDIGSLAINPAAAASDELFGFIYKFYETDVNGPEILRHVPLLEDLNLKAGGIQQVDNFASGASDFLADFNQVEFTSDGRPVIAYTRDTAGSITVWYAYWDGAAWQKEQVSSQAISKYTPNLRIWLDLALMTTTSQASPGTVHWRMMTTG
ncbi:MAG: hypothetical protein R3F46_12560 [bacterium]